MADFYRAGFGMKKVVEPLLKDAYHSTLVADIVKNGNRIVDGDTTVLLAQAFGFCYGVDRAVQYAYETRNKFPDKTIYITNEIIHNPFVNRKLQEMGVRFLIGRDRGGFEMDEVQAGDIVLLPAFGATIPAIEELKKKEAVLVDTTCGSVVNVWKNVEKYAREQITSIVHGKIYHEETRATVSRVATYPGAHYLVLRDEEEAEVPCHYIMHGGDKAEFLKRYSYAVSPDFDPDVHLGRVGCANQTTMLSSESLKIGEMFKEAIRARYGEAEVADRFRAFDTICSATQERQDAMYKLVTERPEIILVIGGYNSSNTTHLAEIAVKKQVPSYHIEDSSCLMDVDTIRHLPVGSKKEEEVKGWLPRGPLRIGITAGASTSNFTVGETIGRLLEFRHALAEMTASVVR